MEPESSHEKDGDGATQVFLALRTRADKEILRNITCYRNPLPKVHPLPKSNLRFSSSDYFFHFLSSTTPIHPLVALPVSRPGIFNALPDILLIVSKQTLP